MKSSLCSENRGGRPKRPTSLNLTSDVSMADVIPFVQLAHSPSVHAYYSLKTEIERSCPRWVSLFLDLGGLDAFLDTLCQITGHTFTNFSDAVLQLDCIGCVRALMNTAIGMQYVTEHPESIYKLMQALDTPNALPKKQILELLTALAMYSTHGHRVFMESLWHYKKLTNQQHLFSPLVNELKNSETASYRVTLMSLINVILRGHPEIKDRSRVRDQFIALNLLDVLGYVRKGERDPELSVQIQMFDDDKHLDEELLHTSHGVDVTSHEQLFALLYHKTCLSPGSSDLLHILQDLVTMATQTQQPELLWSTVSRTVHHLVNLKPDQLESFSDSLLGNCDKTYLNDDKTPRTDNKRENAETDKSEPLGAKTNIDQSESNKLVLYARREHSDSSVESDSSKGTRVQDKDLHREDKCIQRQDSGISVTSPYDNVLDNSVFHRQGSGRGSFGFRDTYKPTRKPQKPVKPVMWESLRIRDTQKPLSVWRMVTEKSYRQKMALDYTSIENEFEQTQNTDEVTDAGDEIHLLEPEESLRLNLLLSRLEAMPEELADTVIEADSSDLTPNGVRLLLEAMPPPQQIARIRASSVPRFTLAPAEQFLSFLSDHADYTTLLHALRFKVTFQARYPRLKGAFVSVITSCRDVLHHHGLRDFLRLMLDAGNFLNAGHGLDPATGVKLNSWRRLLKVKGQGHSSNLLLHLIEAAMKQDDGSVMFANDFPSLEQATGYCLDDMKREVTDLNMQMKQFLCELSQSDTSVREKYQLFVEDVKRDLASLHSNIARLKGISNQMALYFCEQEITFDLQTCLKDLHEFFKAVRQCQKHSSEICQQEAAAAKHREELNEKLEDAHIMKYFGKKADLCSSFVRSQTDPLVDHILGEVHRGNIVYYHDNEPQTPDMSDKLGMSVIPHLVSTPIDDLDVDLESSSFIFQAAGSLCPPTYVDRVEMVIQANYHRNQQRETASFVTDGPAPHASNETLEDTLVSNFQPGELAAKCRPCLPPSLAPANSEIIVYPRIGTPAAAPAGRRRGHMRCSSDLDNSRVVEDRWKTYERQRGADRFPGNEDDVMESSNMVTSLGLETRPAHGLNIQKRKVFILEPEKPVKDKKKKVGFFQRLSQAVLRPRNPNTTQGQGQEDGLSKELTRGSKRWSGRGRKSKRCVDKENNKENMIIENLV